MIEQFLQEHAQNINTIPTTQLHAQWLKYNPKTQYTTVTKFTKALKLYGYVTKAARIDMKVQRVYVKVADLMPVMVICWCGHSHYHTENKGA